MAFDFQEWVRNQKNGGAQYQPQSNQYSSGSAFSWQDFANNYNQIANANQALNQQQESDSWLEKSRSNQDNYKYRDLEGLDWLFAGLNSLSNSLSTGASETLGLGAFDPEEGFTGQNVLRFVANLPGQLLASGPDMAVHLAEAVSGNPYTEADTKSGLIPDYELGADQRAASLGYVGLDALGFIPGLGPEARAAGLLAKGVGAGAKAVGKESASRAIGDAGKLLSDSLVKKEMQRTGSKIGTLEAAAIGSNASKGVTRAAQFGDAAIDIAASSAFEGAQEAGQNLLEDMRYRQFDDGSWSRAANAGAWGALGGGLVSGVSNATSFGKKLSSDPTESPLPVTSPQFEREKARNKTELTGTALPSAVKAATERSRENNEIPGSSSALSTVIDNKNTLTQAGLGEGTIHAMLQADDNGESVEAIAKRFGTTADEIRRIDSKRSSAERVQLYNDLIERQRKAGRPVNIVAGRNPDTKLGLALFDLSRVFDGEGVYMNRQAYMMFGGDVDGDKTQVYFGDNVQHNGYLTKNLKSSATGKTLLDKNYMLFGDSKETLERFDSLVDSLFQQYEGSSSVAESFKKAYRESFKDKDKQAELIADLFDRMRAAAFNFERAQAIRENRTLDPQAIAYKVDNAIASIMSDVESMAVYMPQKFIDVVTKLDEDQRKIFDSLYSVMADAGDRYLTSGETAGARHFAEFAAQLGYKIAANTNLGNPFFRQSGQVYYHAQKDQNMWFGGLGTTQLKNIYDQLIAFSFRLSEIGGDVENSIEGIWRVSIQDEVMSRFAKTGITKVDMETGWNTFSEIFKQVYDEYVGIFNKSLQVPTTKGEFRKALDAARKKTLSSVDQGVEEKAFARAFVEIFGEYYFDDIFDIPTSHPMFGKTISQGIEEYAVHAGRYNGMFANYEGFSHFWKTLLEDYEGKENAIGTRIKNALADIALKIRTIGEHFTVTEEADGRKTLTVDPKYMDVYSEIIDSLNLLIGPDSSWRLNMATIESFLNTAWGQELISGDESRMNKALLSIWLTDQYRTVIDIASNHDLAKEESWLNRAKIEASHLADNSELHMAIFVAIDRYNDFSLLDRFTNLERSWKDNEQEFNRLIGFNYGSASLLAMASRTSDTQMSSTAISDRLTQVDRNLTRAVKKSAEYNRLIVNKVEESIDRGRYTIQQAEEAIREFAKQEYVESSIDSIASFAYSQKDIVKEMVDKGTTPNSSSAIFQQVENMFKGDTISLIDQYGIELGNMSIENFHTNRIQFLRILTDPSAEIRLWDPTSDGTLFLNQKSLFKLADIDIDESGPAVGQLFEFIKRVPQVASIISPQNLDVISEGSTSSVSQGVSQTLDSAINKWVERGSRNKSQLSEPAQRKYIKQLMMQDSDWWGLLVASTRDISNDLSLEETKEVVKEALDNHVSFFLEYAKMSPGENLATTKQIYFSDMYTTALDMAVNVMNDIDMVRKYMELTGTINASVANDASMSSLSMYKLLAVSKLFRDNNVEFDVSKIAEIGFSATQLTSISDLLKEHGQTYLDLSFALMNMADSNDLSFDSYLRAGRFDTKINEIIESIEDEEAKTAIRDEIDSWSNGLGGFLRYMTGSDTLLKESDFVSELVITDAAIPSNGNSGWTEQQWIDRCYKIMDECGRLDDFTEEAVDDIKKQLKDGNFSRIKAYYNNVIVEKLYGDLSFGTGKTVNVDAMQQTLDAKKHMIEMAGRIKEKLSEKYPLEERDSRSVKPIKLPPINFNYSNPAVSYMATSAVMNAQAGSVGSGIGIDGAMTKLIAAYGALPLDVDCGTNGETVSSNDVTIENVGWNYLDVDGELKRIKDVSDVLEISGGENREITLFNPRKCLCWSCSKCSPASMSSSNPKINMMSYALSELASWMQEARHLQAKKTTGFAGLISEGIDPRDDLMKPVPFKLGDGTDIADGVRSGILNILFDRRVELANYWNDKFVNAKKLPLDMQHAIVFSNATTPMAEVITNDGQSIFVSTSDLSDADTFSSRYPMLASGEIKTCRPVIISLQEGASKIIRGICKEYYRPRNKERFSRDDVHSAAERAAKDWSSYNTSKFDLDKVLSGLVSHSPSFNMGVAADSTPSAVMRWNDSAYESISSLFKTTKWESKLMSDSVKNTVREANASLAELGCPDWFSVVHYSSDGIIDAAGSPINRALKRLSFRGDEDGNENIVKIDEKDREAAEFFEAAPGLPSTTTIQKAEEAHRRAAENGRAFIVSYDVFKKMGSLSYNEKARASLFDISGYEFAIIDPSIDSMISYYRGTNAQMATEFLAPENITTAIATEDRLQLPDGAHYTRRDYRAPFMYRSVNEIPVRSLLSGVEPITLVQEYSDISEILQEDIDYSYYEKSGNFGSIESLRQKTDDFIAMARRKSGKSTSQRNVSRDSCIGFVKQQRGMRTVYAPIFYSGSLPKYASSLSIELKHGKVSTTFITDDIDYNGNESMKLDLYGVPYKSVGHMVSQDMQDQFWAAINDCGFNAVLSPEHMFDYHAIAGRVFNMSDAIVQNNLFYFSRKVGVNLFFDIDASTLDENGNPVIKRKAGLNPSITDDQLADLASGSRRAWMDVASGTKVLFSDINGDQKLTAELNDIIKRLSSELLLTGGFPHLFFNSREIRLGEDGRWVDNGIWPRDMTFRMATKYMNRDQTLKLFHLLDSRLCPNGWEDGAEDRLNTVFDRSGKMIDMNTLSGNPERVYALVGPHFYTGQGTALSNPSKTAQYSNQHMIKRMMELGVFAPQIDDLIGYLGTQVGQYDSLTESPAQRLARLDLSRQKRVVNKDLYDKMALTMDDPIQYAGIDRYRNNVLAPIAEELTHRLPVTMNDLETDAFSDKGAALELENARASLNKACGNPGPKEELDWGTLLQLVRLEVGFTENQGRGQIKGLTYRQVINSIERMKENISDGDGLLIKGGIFFGANGDIRGHIPILPKGLNARLMMLPKVNGKYKGDVNKMMEDQRAEYETNCLPQFETISDEGKRKALFRFADAMCYANGIDTISGHVLDNIYMSDIVKAIKEEFGDRFQNYDPSFLDKYDEMSRLNEEFRRKIEKNSSSKISTSIVDQNGKSNTVFKGDARNIGIKILRGLSETRKGIGMSYAFMLPANVAERAVNQGFQSLALTLGQTGLSPYSYNNRIDPKIAKQAVTNADFKEIYIGYRSAELAGVEHDLLARVRDGQDIKTAIQESLKSKGKYASFIEKFMNVMSGSDIFIEGQMRNFIDRFAQRAETSSPLWTLKPEGSNLTLLEQKLESNPAQWFIDVLNGSSESAGADMILARQCLNWAKRGDMAQKNIVSAIYSEIASRHAGFEFFTTAFVSPYFQYATNRIGRIMNWVAPISSIHYLVTEFLTKGPGKNLPVGKGVKMSALVLEDVQFQANLREAVTIDILHLGPQLVTFILLGMAGAIEPPDDEDKWGNFKEWTILGQRLDVAWWLEDILGLSLPMAIFGKSLELGKPRLDILVNGIAYYLGNNPVTKVADAVEVLFDPLSELQQDYDKDIEGYAKAMGGPPQLSDIVNGKATSMGLSFVSQFITPGFVREIYNGCLEYEPSYKRVYETDATGQLTEDAKENNKTQYTSYQDAIVRKYTKNNPVMGLLANLVLQPQTGYLATQMPDRIIYDPEQLNSIEAFSLYNDPWTKTDPKTNQEQLATCIAAFTELQSKSVDQLYREGFLLDYDTKVYISKWIWDNIASLNEQWYEMEQSGQLDYYVAGNGDYSEGRKIVSELKQSHSNLVKSLESVYYDKLWSDKLKSPAQYNQLHTKWAQDANGEWYATGYYPSWWKPVTLIPGETQNGYQYVMSRENDWTTESIVTGNSTGQRGLVPREVGKVTTPDIKSWSEDGTSTGHSDIYENNNPSSTSSGNKNVSSASSKTSSTRSSGGSGGSGRSSGGGGGRSYTPSFYAPSVSLPRTNSSRIMNTDRAIKPNYDYLRPDFETKGSREAYRRSDI